MTGATEQRDRSTEYLGYAAVILPAAVLAGVLWLVAGPFLSRASATSLALTTLWCVTSALQTVVIHRRAWRMALVSSLVQFVILWPLVWLMVSYSLR
jgi:hypothetical protein